MSASDVIVIGGGVIGCSIAYHLAQAGVRVTVFERGEIGGEASGAAAGMLLPVDESLEPGPIIDLCIASLSLFGPLAGTLQQDTGIDIEYVRSGVIRVALTDDEARELRQTVHRSQGLLEWVDPDSLRGLEPRLAATRGGFYFPHLDQVNAGRFTQALARAAQRLGAEIHQGVAVTSLLIAGSRVTGVRTRQGKSLAGHVVLAAGAWTAKFGRQLGLTLPVRPVRGQMLAFARSPVRHIVAWEEDSFLLPKANGLLFVGSTEEDVGYRKNTTKRALARLRRKAGTLAPSLAHADVASTWAGLRPATPDGLPILGPVPGWQGVTVASGHFRKGILLAPLTGRLIAQHLTSGDAEIPLSPHFTVERFSNRRAQAPQAIAMRGQTGTPKHSETAEEMHGKL